MEKKLNVRSLYSAFRKNIDKKPYQIIKTLKSLAISTSEYSNFYSSATNLFQRKTFKLPNETNYPILKQSQRKYISLKNQLKTFSFHDKQYEPKELILPQKPIRLKKVFSEVKQKKKIKKRNVNFFICDNNYGGKYNKLFKYYISNSKYSRNNKLPPDFYLNINSFKNIYPVEEIKNPEERIKDFFKFLNTIFIGDNYNNLKYDENEIFGHKEDYINYIKDEFTYFYQKEKEVDKKSFLYHSFKTKDYGIAELYFKSGRIDIIDESYKYNNVRLSINIPFSLMNLIFLVNFEQLDEILFYIFNKLNIKEKENNILSEEICKSLFLEILEKIKYENKKITFDLAYKNYERYYSKIFFLEKIQEVSETIRYNYFLTDFNKNQDIIKVIDNSLRKLYTSNNYLNKNRILFTTNINDYKQILISQNKIKYKIKFIMPEVSMIFTDYEKQLNHCINKELFVYLYQNNFMDWDFYILHYLFYQKNFRLFIGKVLSLKNNLNLLLTKRIVNLENRKIEFTSSKSNDLCEKDKSISLAINNSYKKYYLSNLYSYKIFLTENDFEFSFFCLNENNIDLCKFKSYTIYAFLNNINKLKIFEYNFNFKQMRILQIRSLFENFESAIQRLLYVKDDIIYLDYSYFDNFYSLTNQEIKEYFFKLHKNIKYIKEDEEQKLNSVVVKIVKPYIELLSSDKNKQDDFYFSQYYIQLNDNFLNTLINNEVCKWPKIIEENSQLFKKENYIMHGDKKVKKRKRKNQYKGKKKDFKSAFMQFLRISSKNVP